MKDYSYVIIKFYKEDIELFKKITTQICGKKDLYYSNIIKSISGNVSHKIHITIFYGFKEYINKKDVHSYIKAIKLKEIKLGKLFMLPGWKNQYQVLCIEVLDNNYQLKKIHDDFKQFDYEPKVQYPYFTPHITLAFVKPDYVIRNNIKLPKSLKIKEIKFIKEH